MKKQWWYIAAGVGGLVLLSSFTKKETKKMAKSYLGRTNLPRGIRNNNPGNLVKTAIAWQGKVPHDKNTDSRFEQFINVEWGIRAMLKDIKNDMVKDGKNTIRKLINEYAPPHENNTVAYINGVATKLFISPDTIISPTDKILKELGMSIAEIENGKTVWQYLNASDFDAAISLM